MRPTQGGARAGKRLRPSLIVGTEELKTVQSAESPSHSRRPDCIATRRSSPIRRFILKAVGCAAVCLTLVDHIHAQVLPEFHITLSAQVADQPVSGRLFLFATTSQQKQPMQGPNWFSPEPFAAIEVSQLPPGGTVVIDQRADAFPDTVSRWPAGDYRVQAVLDHDIYYPEAAAGPGNFFSSVVSWQAGQTGRVQLTLDQVVAEVPLEDSQRVRFVQRVSPRLSAFFGREIIDRAAVILPESYELQPQRRYPVYYEVTGFGGSLRGIEASRSRSRNPATEQVEFIQVILTGECKYGHHVYANSATNGPRGDALVHELIPHIDEHYRTISRADARFVGGHSSGGWSSLWLQINYPDEFGGVFSSAPDPVDFRDFQRVNLYAQPPESVYHDPAGNRRPLARRGSQVLLWFDDFCKMDRVLGRGGQMRSFDAVFSPLDELGQPRRCWHPETGRIDPEVAEAWRRYDISWQLEQNWDRLREPLHGKIHIVMGELDTLSGRHPALAERLQELGSDAQIEFIAGAGHNLPPTALEKLRQARIELFLAKYTTTGHPR